MTDQGKGKKPLPEEHFANHEVAALFTGYSEAVRNKLLLLRELIFDVAAKHEEIGQILETIKWNVPAYLTVKPQTGLTIRLDPLLKQSQKIGIYVHCQSSLIARCRSLFADQFEYEAQRGILLNINTELPIQELRQVIYLALTYHLGKKKSGTQYNKKNY